MSDPITPQNPETPRNAATPQNAETPAVPQAPEAAQVPPVPVAPVVAPAAPTPPPAYGTPATLPPAGATPPPAYAASANPYAGTPAKKQPLLSIFAMIAGLIGLVGSPVAFIPLLGGFLGLFFPAAAVVLGYLGRKKEPQARGFWLTGIITGFVAIALMILSIVLWAIIFASVRTNGYYN